MSRSRRPFFEWRFSLSEVLVAVAIDALLAGTILDASRIGRAESAYLFYGLLIVTFIIVPLIVVPAYVGTYGVQRGRLRGWHNRRNDLLIAVDLLLIAAATFVALYPRLSWPRSLRPNRDAYRMIAVFVPIAFTLFVAYSMIVQRLRRDHRSADRPPG